MKMLQCELAVWEVLRGQEEQEGDQAGQAAGEGCDVLPYGKTKAAHKSTRSVWLHSGTAWSQTAGTSVYTHG